MQEGQERKIIDKFVRGLSTSEEEIKLYRRCKERPELWNALHDSVENYNPLSDSNVYVEEKWKSFERKTRKETVSNYHRLGRGVLKYAAVILIAVVGYYLFDSKILNSGDEGSLIAFETYVPKGEKSIVTLPDGTTVNLNADTRLCYYSDFVTNRRVYLSGEGYFQVAHQSKNPFRVETDFYTTKVLGTKFNTVAYSDMKHAKTTLESGRVLIGKETGGEMVDLVMLQPYEQFIYDVQSQSYKVQKANVLDVLSWQSNALIFDNISLGEMVKELERHFNVSILMQDSMLSQIKYRGKFKNGESLKEVLDIIRITTPIKYVDKKDEIEIIKLD